MAKPIRKPPLTSSWDSQISLLVWLSACISVLSFLFYYRNREIMLYGDAVAHINIARRVFDSLTPGLLQLGTVWLPLPHLLMIPFLISNQMWQRGVGGSIPSMAAYLFAVAGVFRLVRDALLRSGDDLSRLAASAAAWAAALLLAANPNLIYMQTTAMGEALYLAFFIWSVVYFAEFVRGRQNALTRCGLCLGAACLTRYDGWFLAAAMACVIVALAIRPSEPGPGASVISRRAAVRFVLLAAAAPALWLAYNGIVYRNPLEFENGPYSAKAIELRTQTAGNPGHPGSGNPVLAELYFVKSGEITVASNPWLERTWVLLAFAALVFASMSSTRKSYWPLLLILVPLPFYALSVAYGGVPIFVPDWWPFSRYNVRYGLQLLPAFAAAVGILVYATIMTTRWSAKLRTAIVAALLIFAAVSYATVWRAAPVTLQEARINMRGRNHLEAQLASFLRLLPPDSRLLMYLGDHVGAVQQAGIPLRRVINEGNHRVWMQPRDPDGLWERALADPAKYAGYVLAFKGDPVWQAVEAAKARGDDHLQEVFEIHVSGQAHAILYRTSNQPD
ncbi:MAG TPA: hypothetical protein VMG31_16890 [Verrucomicrobiae bacterium]|nr:hypothetical protein [Verrucomicrobiae bacterium]